MIFRSEDRHAAAEELAQRADEEDLDPQDTPELDMGDVDEYEIVDSRMRIKCGGHWYRTLDATAGVRAYMGQRGATRFWHGFYNQKAVDHFTGGVLATVFASASRQEDDIYPELSAQVERVLGRQPETMIADKGFSVEKVFRHNTEQGVATIVRRKESGGDFKRHDKDTHDRHGIPRSKHCGGTTTFVRFAAQPKPRIWFDCQIGQTKDCMKTQTISCSKDYRLLIPLWRTDPLYHELRLSHEHYENAHNLWRSRYRIAPDDLGIRPKRRGIRWQQLRASAALVVEWLRICAGQGWLASARAAVAAGVRRANWKQGGENAAAGLLGYRAFAGVSEPYGKRAEKLRIGKLLPPSRRQQQQPVDNGDYAAGPLLL